MRSKLLIVSAFGVFLCLITVNSYATILYGLTGDGGSPSETLFTIDINSGAGTQILPLGNGNDGEGLAFNPNDGLLYHSSGISDGDEFFETIDPMSLTIGPNLTGGTYGPDPAAELGALAWYQPLGVFLASERFNSNFFHVTTTGQFTQVGDSGGGTIRGLAVVGNQVFGINPFDSELFEIDPFNGNILNTLPLTIDGLTPDGGNGLATHPVTGEVYALIKDPNGSGSTNRLLATIDITTGAATSIGSVPQGLAAITFGAAMVPVPSTLLLFGLGGFIGLVLMRKR